MKNRYLLKTLSILLICAELISTGPNAVYAAEGGTKYSDSRDGQITEEQVSNIQTSGGDDLIPANSSEPEETTETQLPNNSPETPADSTEAGGITETQPSENDLGTPTDSTEAGEATDTQTSEINPGTPTDNTEAGETTETQTSEIAPGTPADSTEAGETTSTDTQTSEINPGTPTDSTEAGEVTDGLSLEIDSGIPINSSEEEEYLTGQDINSEEALGETDTQMTPKPEETENIEAEGGLAGTDAEKTGNDRISPLSAGTADFMVSIPAESFSYTKGGVKPAVTVTSDSEILRSGTDYTVKYTDYKKPGTAKVTVTGKGAYSGRVVLPYEITQADIAGCLMLAGDVVYNPQKKGFVKPTVYINDVNGKALKAGTDFYKTYSYLAEGIDYPAGVSLPTGTEVTVTVTGKGYYTGSVSAKYRIVAASLAKATVKTGTIYWDDAYSEEGIRLDPDKIIVTAGGAIVPHYSETDVLQENFTILENTYSGNKKPGKATVRIRGVGNYGGIKTVTFTISKKSKYHAVTFDPGGATSGKMSDKKMLAGKSYKLPKNGFKKKGYAFAGWSETPGGTIVYGNKGAYQNGMPVDSSQIGEVTRLYAAWEPVNYTISYKNTSDASNPNPDTYTYEQVRYGGLALSDPVRTGYDFAGWYKDKKCTAKKRVYEIPRGSAANLTFYAKWITPRVGPASDEVESIYDNTDSYYNPVEDQTSAVNPNDGVDDTDAINAAIQSVAASASASNPGYVYLPAGTYNITPSYYGIELESNVSLVMDRNAVLKCSPAVSTDKNQYHVISVIDEQSGHIENVKVIGGRIQGERSSHNGDVSTYRGHGVAVCGATNVLIAEMEISNNWGDGIYVGTKKEFDVYYGCKDVTIQNCEIHGNRRNNISIVDADNLTVEGCNIYDAYGIAPQCGILIEPNFEAERDAADARCMDIVIRNTVITAYKNKNSSSYMCFLTNYDPNDESYVVVDGLKVENCTFYGYYGMYSGYNYSESGNTYKGSHVVGSFVRM